MKLIMGNGHITGIDRALMLAIALIPAIYAWSTWDHSASSSLAFSRQFGPIALMVELAVIAFAAFQFRGLGIAARRLGSTVAIGLCFIALIAFFSGQMSDHPRFALFKNVANLIHLLFGIALCSLLSSRWGEQRPEFLKILLAGLAAYLVTVMLYIATAPPGFDWMFFGMTAQNVRNLGSHMMSVAVFGLGALLVMKGRWRGFAFVVASVALALLFWSGSRGPFLGVVLAIILATPALPIKRAAALIGATLLSGVTGALLSFVHVVPDSRFGLMRALGLAQHEGSSDITSGRIEVWMKTIEYLKTMPIWGYGDGQYFHIVTDLRQRLAFPHNVELQLLFQWGWIAGGLAIIFLLWLMWRAFWMTRETPDTRLPGLLILIAIFVLGHLDGPFYDTLPMGIFAIGAAICLARKEKPPPTLN